MALKYRPELDGLRALAITSVMGFHFVTPLMSGGSLGVDVFFVLSGWLITSILASEAEGAGRIDYGAFLLRRARRLLPALTVLLVAYVSLAPLLFPQFASRRWLDAASAAFYLTNLRETFWPAESPLSHTWSLAIEEQFYILWPLALLGLLRLPRRSAAQLLIGAWTALSLARVACLHLWQGPAAYYFTPLHATGLLLGAALALHPVATSLGRVALAILVALFIAGRTSQTFVFVQPIAEIAAAAVIANPAKFLGAAPLRFLGRISYGVYLWHIPIMWALGRPKSPLEVGVLVGASVLAGWLSHVGVEQWFLRSPKTVRALPEPAG